jgi:hypothetical protein
MYPIDKAPEKAIKNANNAHNKPDLLTIASKHIKQIVNEKVNANADNNIISKLHVSAYLSLSNSGAISLKWDKAKEKMDIAKRLIIEFNIGHISLLLF